MTTDRAGYQRAYQAKRKADGLCPHCKTKTQGQSMCPKHMDENRARARRRQRGLRAAGLCGVCGKRTARGQACDPCKTRRRQRHVELKRHVMHSYGGACACCGVDKLDFLTIDHINGRGAEHRAELFGNRGQAGVHFYRWLHKNGMPDGFQVLCFNCNVSKHLGGSCIHKREA